MQKELMALLAGRRGHFQMESGYHSELWFELDALLRRREQLRPYVTELGRRLTAHRIDAVCGPMTGGAKLARRIADEQGVEYLFTERFEPKKEEAEKSRTLFPVRYELPAKLREQARGKRVAIVDDAVSAGSAVRGTYTNLIVCGARPVAIGALFIFGEAAAGFASGHQLALEGLARVDYKLWPPAECPLCLAGLAFEPVSDAAPPTRSSPGQPSRGASARPRAR